MFRIRWVTDDTLPTDKRTIAQVQDILRARFPGLSARDVDSLPDKLHDPVTHKLRAMLFLADDMSGDIQGFALLSHASDLRFCYLDYVATTMGSGGVGGALYERLRDVAKALGAIGLFYECLPDEPGEYADPLVFEESVARMRFYERFGARPIVNTAYESPVRPGDTLMPHLMFDDLGSGRALRRDKARRVVRAILERRYAHLCPPDYVNRVVGSFRDDPVHRREWRYGAPQTRAPAKAARRLLGTIVVVVTDAHELHHIRERGYVEAPVRVRALEASLEPTGLFRRLPPRPWPDEPLRAVHDGAFLDYLERVCVQIGPDKSVYPYVFPIRNAARPPEDLPVRAGYYCIDTFTPLNLSAWNAARRAAECALTAAQALLDGERLTYALVRPPGHHAETRVFGGFCYLNNAAIAAQHLVSGGGSERGGVERGGVERGGVAILDLDYHHGNGQQEIFYERDDVLTVSIHGHPRFAYPYFSGFADECGAGAGEGYNLNLPLDEEVGGPDYRVALRVALARVRAFAPRHLVVCMGFDTARADPTGTWSLGPRDFEESGRLVGALGLPTLVTQEGGYRTRSLGACARAFFTGLATGALGPAGDTRR
ncbi:MAG: histone deacetylase family protein [Pseudomonadota bacterium]|nr:histone deacetylase family protein [Pseudomonadota bacterium]